MDRTKVAEALRTALQSGVTEHQGIPGVDPASDLALFTKATTIGTTDPGALTRLVEIMALDPTFAELGNNHVSGGGHSSMDVRLLNIAHNMLAQVFASGGDVDQVVADTAQILETNEADILYVMALVGVRVDHETQLGPNVRLLPVSEIPLSMPRGQALGQEPPFGRPMWRPTPATAALTIKRKVSPLVASPQELAGGAKQYLDAMSVLDEARDCLNLIRLCAPITHSAWAQFLLPVAYFANRPVWSSIGEQSLLVETIDIDVNEARQLGAAYFAWPNPDREKALRVPLNRLARAVRQRNSVDQAIDLGIALEALLLHDNTDEVGELSHRLSLRGAWLGGDDVGSRDRIFRLLRELYKLRSAAVHKGDLGHLKKMRSKKAPADVLEQGITVCAELIRTAINKGGVIQNWPTILLGGDAPGARKGAR